MTSKALYKAIEKNHTFTICPNTSRGVKFVYETSAKLQKILWYVFYENKSDS